MWGPCCPTITAKSILIKNTTEGATHKKCKEIERQKVGMKGRKMYGKERGMRDTDEKKMTEKEKYKTEHYKMVRME